MVLTIPCVCVVLKAAELQHETVFVYVLFDQIFAQSLIVTFNFHICLDKCRPSQLQVLPPLRRRTRPRCIATTAANQYRFTAFCRCHSCYDFQIEFRPTGVLSEGFAHTVVLFLGVVLAAADARLVQAGASQKHIHGAYVYPVRTSTCVSVIIWYAPTHV